MNITISMLVKNPEVDLNLPHELLNLLKNEIVNKVLLPKGLMNVDVPLTMISIFPDDVVKKPAIEIFFDRPNAMDTYFFKIPYGTVASSGDKLRCFVDIFFDLLEELFSSMNLDGLDLSISRSRVIYEIDETPEIYRNVEPDDNGLDDILGKLGLS